VSQFLDSSSSGLANIDRSGGFVDWLLEREDVQKVWKEFTHHEFVEKMGDGTLPVERFKFYMVQDYLYLVSLIIMGMKTILTIGIDAVC
jgi:thiaminase